MNQLESMIQSLKDKHAVEMEALLSALADSQRTTRVLREENGNLRDRILDLEDQLNDVVEKWDSVPSPMRARPRTPLFLTSSPGSAEPSPKRHPRIHSYVASDHQPPAQHEREIEAPEGVAPDATVHISPNGPGNASGRSLRQRYSTASSIFPIVPNNMSMLMQEDGGSADQSGLYTSSQPRSRSASPLSSPNLVPRYIGKNRHATQRSVSSVGNISPTTADFSMSMTGSPGSLHLRPEHERHLGDMISFDLGEDDTNI